MGQVGSFKNILTLLVQGTVLGLIVALAINSVRAYLGGPDMSPSSEKCSELSNYSQSQQFESLRDFYPYYLCEHSNPLTKLFHFVGTFNALLFLITIFDRKLSFSSLKLLVAGIVQVKKFLSLSFRYSYPCVTFILADGREYNL